jgi:SPP1 family predicted phage head-tail adaptor
MNNKMINAGKYRHRITVRDVPTDASRDTFGGRKGLGRTVCAVWAEKTDWSGAETNESNRETASVTTRWRTRYRTDIQPKMQIYLGTDVYQISNVLDFDGTHRELTIESVKVIS